MPGRVLEEQRSFGGLDQIGQSAAVSAVAVGGSGGDQVLNSDLVERSGQPVCKFLHPRGTLLPCHPQIPKARVASPGSVGTSPEAGVQAWEDRGENSVAELDPFATAHANHLLDWNASLLKKTNRLIAPN